MKHIALAACLLLTQPALAADNLANLGPPTNATLPFSGPGSFQHVGHPWQLHAKPEFLFLGSPTDPFSAAERWPVVKALDQFGTFSHLRKGLGQPMFEFTIPIPTFDWSHATYQSRYLAFVHRDGPGQRESPTERVLAARYFHRFPMDAGPFTALFIGGYYMRGSGVPPGVIADQSGKPVSFETVQRAMQLGYARHWETYVYDIEAEANVLIALICHADGRRPASVCGRPAIKSILRHVK